MTDREFVEAHWERVWLYDGARKLELSLEYPVKFRGATKDGADALWSAAAAFTRERLEEVRQLREEMNLLRGMIALLAFERGDLTAPIYKRTITRLESILADKLKGMKGVA